MHKRAPPVLTIRSRYSRWGDSIRLIGSTVSPMCHLYVRSTSSLDDTATDVQGYTANRSHLRHMHPEIEYR